MKFLQEKLRIIEQCQKKIKNLEIKKSDLVKTILKMKEITTLK